MSAPASATGFATRVEALAATESGAHVGGDNSSTTKLPKRNVRPAGSDPVWSVDEPITTSMATHRTCACAGNATGPRKRRRSQADAACCVLLQQDSDNTTATDALDKACDAGLAQPAEPITHSSILPSLGQGTIKREREVDAETTAAGSSASDGAGGDGGKREVCCREQIEEDRSLISHDVVRDMCVVASASRAARG